MIVRLFDPIALRRLALALAMSSVMVVLAASLLQISSDPYTNTDSQHATQVEPDSFAFGSTIVTVVQTGRFFIIDLSSLGTTLNGRHVPKGYDEVDGTKRENHVETPLPDQARIGLADTVYLDFRIVP